MGIIQITVETARGDARAKVVDDKNVLAKILPSAEEREYRCLNKVDLYGDTLFNRLQLDDLEADIVRLLEKTMDEDQHALLVRLRSMVSQVHRDDVLFVKFYGD